MKGVQKQYSIRSRHGFTLVELSVVLIILALLVGGILGGRQLVRAAEIRGLANDIGTYSAAVTTFKEQYGNLPGDMPDAFDYWGAAAGCTDADVNSTAAGCNGNADGLIPWQTENYRAWQFLALSRNIPGQYTGTHTGVQPNVNAPETRIDGVAISMDSDTSFMGTTDTNFFRIGMERAGWRNEGVALSPQEAWNLDRKIDDGLPRQGVMGAGGGWNGAGWFGTCDTATSYILDEEDVVCNIQHLLPIN